MSQNAFVHKIVNASSSPAWICHRHPPTQRSFDLLLQPGDSQDYSNLYAASSAELPGAGNAEEFERRAMIIKAGPKTWKLFHRDAQTRCTAEGWSDAIAPIPGDAHAGPIDLVITDQEVKAQTHRMIDKPFMASVSPATGQYGYYGVNSDGRLVEKYYPLRWNPWRELDAPLTKLAGPIAATWWTAFQLGIFALGENGGLYEKGYSGSWGDWIEHKAPSGSPLVSLTAVRWAEYRYGVYGVDKAGQLQEFWHKPGKWNGWNNLGAPPNVSLTGPIASCNHASFQYCVFALGSDSNVWRRSASSSWDDNWELIGRPDNVEFKSLSSVCWGDRRFSVVGVSQAGDLWAREYEGTGWRRWENLGHPEGVLLEGPVTGVSWVLMGYGYYAIGVDGDVYTREYDNYMSRLNRWKEADGS